MLYSATINQAAVSLWSLFVRIKNSVISWVYDRRNRNLLAFSATGWILEVIYSGYAVQMQFKCTVWHFCCTGFLRHQTASFGDVVKQLRIMGVVVFVIKQSPLLMEIYARDTGPNVHRRHDVSPPSLSSKLNLWVWTLMKTFGIKWLHNSTKIYNQVY